MKKLENDTLEIRVYEEIRVSDQSPALPKLRRAVRVFSIFVSEIFNDLQVSVGVNHFALPPSSFAAQNFNLMAA